MVKEIKYTSIRRVLDNLMDHPMLQDLTLEQAVRHTMRFISLNGFPKLYQDREADVEIKEFRGMLPCDLVSIVQVKDCKDGLCMRAMTDNFMPHERKSHFYGEPAFKTQGRVIFTSFPEGTVRIAYKAIPVDDDGFPMLLDNENYLAALEAYIKKQMFIIKFDQQKLPQAVLENAKQEYAWLAGQLQSELQIPSESEMQSISNMINSMIPRMSQFYFGFKHEGDRQYIRNH